MKNYGYNKLEFRQTSEIAETTIATVSLKRCEVSDIDRISQFYQYVCESTKNMELFGKWIYGLRPTKK